MWFIIFEMRFPSEGVSILRNSLRHVCKIHRFEVKSYCIFVWWGSCIIQRRCLSLACQRTLYASRVVLSLQRRILELCFAIYDQIKLCWLWIRQWPAVRDGCSKIARNKNSHFCGRYVPFSGIGGNASRDCIICRRSPYTKRCLECVAR